MTSRTLGLTLFAAASLALAASASLADTSDTAFPEVADDVTRDTASTWLNNHVPERVPFGRRATAEDVAAAVAVTPEMQPQRDTGSARFRRVNEAWRVEHELPVATRR